MDTVYQAAYQRARAARLPHSEAAEEARIAAAQILGEQAQQAQAQAAVANPQAAHSWTRYDMINHMATATLDAGLDPMQRQMRETRAAQIRAELAALDKQIDALVAPLRQRQQALVEELNRL